MGEDLVALHNDLLVLSGMHRRDYSLLTAQASALGAKEDAHGFRVSERAEFHLHTAERLTDAAIAINNALQNGVNA